MPAQVEFVLGRAGSGKSRKLRHDICALAKKGEKIILIVHEQFTFENERMLADELGGLLNISVLSFTSLARRVLAETGCNKTFLSPQGRRMLIRKVADENDKKLIAFANVCKTPGFADKCDELFTKCKRFSISPADLNLAAEKLQEATPLKDKLSDISLLYEHMQDFLQAHYLDSDDLYTELYKRLPGSSICGSHVFVDSFERANAQTYSIMEQLMEHAASLFVSLRLDNSPGCRDAGVFLPDKRAYHKLYAMAKEHGCRITETYLPIKGAPWGEVRYANPALSHLERELYAYPAQAFEGEQDCISVFEASDRVAEVEALACAVQKYSREGYRYRDMAVMVSDMEAYASSIRREFTRQHIPVFMDAKRPLQGHPVVELIVAALRCANRGFMQEDMLRLIKSNFCGLTFDETEIFENFILAYGIRGNRFKEPFSQKDVPSDAQSARAVVMEPLLMLKEGLSKPTAGEKTIALYDYLVKIEVYKTLTQRVEALKLSGQFEFVEENAQVWNVVMELLSQVYEIMGDVKLGTARYIAILEEGLNAYEVGIIPTTIDQVLVGTVDRTRRSSVKLLFVTGCNDGSLPPVRSDDGVIDDTELAKMSELGITPWANTIETAEHDRLDIYSAFSKPTESLWLSYSIGSGESCGARSMLVDKILKIFPGAILQSDIKPETQNQCEGLYCAQAAIKPLVRQLRAFADTGEVHNISSELYAWFSRKEEYTEQLDKIRSALFYDPSPALLGEELTLLLYGRRIAGSASRLETFAKCPFMHFMQHGLKAAERPENSDKPKDVGIFYHKALDTFTHKVTSENIRWSELDESKCDALMDGILAELFIEYRDGALLETARSRALCLKAANILKCTARAILRQMSDGDFSMSGSEICFGHDQPYPALVINSSDGTAYELSGKIDRLDRSLDQAYIRIVDYKTNGMSIKFAKLYEGITLQLPLYLAAVLAFENSAKAAGMYYMPIKEPFADEQEDADALSKKLTDALRLEGLSLSDVRLDKSIVKSHAVSVQQLKSVLAFALNKADKALSRIKRGDVSVRPYKLSQNDYACLRCAYQSVCGFDPRISRCSYHYIKSMKMQDFFERLSYLNEGKTHQLDS